MNRIMKRLRKTAADESGMDKKVKEAFYAFDDFAYDEMYDEVYDYIKSIFEHHNVKFMINLDWSTYAEHIKEIAEKHISAYADEEAEKIAENSDEVDSIRDALYEKLIDSTIG